MDSFFGTNKLEDMLPRDENVLKQIDRRKMVNLTDEFGIFPYNLIGWI